VWARYVSLQECTAVQNRFEPLCNIEVQRLYNLKFIIRITS